MPRHLYAMVYGIGERLNGMRPKFLTNYVLHTDCAYGTHPMDLRYVPCVHTVYPRNVYGMNPCHVNEQHITVVVLFM